MSLVGFFPAVMHFYTTQDGYYLPNLLKKKVVTMSDVIG